MDKPTRILAINGSYRDNGITDQALEVAIDTLRGAGAEVDTLLLRKESIEFCLNCRACTHVEGTQPGECVLDDAMHGIIDRIEQADAYIFAVPTNFGSATAVFKRFMERLTPYGFWPRDAIGPKYRKEKLPQKKAMLITSCAAPGIFARVIYSTSRQLKMAAHIIGAKVTGAVYVGLIARQSEPQLPGRARMRTQELAAELVAV
jgi:multimeric flavodoxin WrbA